MALGIYKPGQGYWVRVLTASLAALMTVAFAAWAWGQCKVFVANLPRSNWVMNLSEATGAVAPGSRVSLEGVLSSQSKPEDFGSAVVASYDAASGVMRVGSVEITVATVSDPSITKRIHIAGADGANVFDARINGTIEGLAPIQPLYLQGAMASLILIVGACLIYWLCAVKPQSSEFLIATDMEMKKVNWSTRKDIIGSTWVVISWSLIIAACLFIFDVGFRSIFGLIGVLQSS